MSASSLTDRELQIVSMLVDRAATAQGTNPTNLQVLATIGTKIQNILKARTRPVTELEEATK